MHAGIRVFPVSFFLEYSMMLMQINTSFVKYDLDCKIGKFVGGNLQNFRRNFGQWNHTCQLIQVFIIWLQQYACSNWLLKQAVFSCNDQALLARCPRHIQPVFNLIVDMHPYGHPCCGQFTAVKKVFTDQYHMTVLQAQVYNSLR